MNDEGIRTTDNVDSLLGNPEKALWRMSIPLIIALMGIGNGLGAGSASALSKYIGEGRKKKADNGSIHSIIITVLISILTTIFLMIFLKPILIAMGVGGTIGYALEYGTVISLGSILIILSNSLYGVLRGEGDANRSMYAMLFSSILNLGVKGAAAATVISLLLVNLILLYWFYIKKNTYLKPFLSNFKFDWDISFDILKVGLPASLELINNALFAGLFSLLLATVASTDAVAVYSTGWRVVTIGTTPMLAIATALISVVGANYGDYFWNSHSLSDICFRSSDCRGFHICRNQRKADSKLSCIPIRYCVVPAYNGIWSYINLCFPGYRQGNYCNVSNNFKRNCFLIGIRIFLRSFPRLWRVWGMVWNYHWRACGKYDYYDLG